MGSLQGAHQGARYYEQERASAAGVRERERALRQRFTCDRCGKTFELPESSDEWTYKRGPGARSRFVRLGDHTVCEKCAAKRFRRRIDWNAAVDPAACQ